ncbi:MAG: nitroreductase family protein [archaeon]
MDLRDAVEGRRSVRRYLDKKPDWRKILRAIDAARFAPSAGGKFVMKFILVSDEKKIAGIAAATQQDFVGSVKYIVVAVSDDSKLVQSYEERGVRFAAQQAGAAIENFLLALTEEKLVTTWVGYFYEEQIRRVLGIPDDLSIEAVFPIGLETKIKGVASKRAELENIIYFDKWGQKEMVPRVKVSREVV